MIVLTPESNMQRVLVILFLLASIISYSQNNSAESIEPSIKVPKYIAAVYPGCHGDNKTLEKCFSEKVKEHLYKTFNGNILDLLAMPDGKYTVLTQFKINKEGKVKSIYARGPHQELEWEAIRALKSLPKMGPAKENGNPIEIVHSLPLHLIMKDNKVVNSYLID